MNIYIAPIQSTPQKKGNSARQKSRQGSATGSFQDVLQRVGLYDEGRGKRDGFTAEPMQRTLGQADIGFVQQRVQRVNEELLAMLR